jgi:hypothetical protein
MDLENAEGLRDRVLQVLISALQILVRETSTTGKKFEDGAFAVIACLEGMTTALHGGVMFRNLRTILITTSRDQYKRDIRLSLHDRHIGRPAQPVVLSSAPGILTS